MFSQCRRWGKISVQTFSYRYLKTLTEGAVTTDAGSLFQYFTTVNENADPLLRRWLAPLSTFKGCPVRPRRAGGMKNKCGSIFKRPLNTLKAVIRSARSRHRCSLSSLLIFEFALDGWYLQRGLVNRLAYHVRGADALSPRIKGWKPISKDLGRSALSWRSIVLLYLWLQCTEQREITPRSLTNLDTGIGVPDPSGKKAISEELLAKLWGVNITHKSNLPLTSERQLRVVTRLGWDHVAAIITTINSKWPWANLGQQIMQHTLVEFDFARPSFFQCHTQTQHVGFFSGSWVLRVNYHHHHL